MRVHKLATKEIAFHIIRYKGFCCLQQSLSLVISSVTTQTTRGGTAIK